MEPTTRAPLRRQGGYRPPHCPNPECAFHVPDPAWHYVRRGSWIRPSDQRRIQAYRCSACRRNFSGRTFTTSYWLRHRSLLLATATWAAEGPGLRQSARALQTSHTTVRHLLERLGRHTLLFHFPRLQTLTLAEPLIADGFESFAFSHYFPFHATFAVGQRSWCLYLTSYSPLRRKGAMTPYQRQRRAELEARLGRPDPKAVEQGLRDLLAPLLPQLPPHTPLHLHTDDHPAYRRALRAVRRQRPAPPPIHHHVTPGHLRRTPRNPLFPVNLADLLVRHGQANHRRQTIAYSKRPQSALARLAVFLVWRNYIKRRQENGGTQTAAMVAGLADRPWSWRQVLRRRLFPAHVRLPAGWAQQYWGQVPSPVYGARQRGHARRYAF
jgi:hypothetical protein